MLGWMDDEALHRTLTTGRCTYWSRSRQEYWVKGETSGHQQWVKSVAPRLRRRRAAGQGRPGRRGLPHRRPDLLRRRRAAQGAIARHAPEPGIRTESGRRTESGQRRESASARNSGWCCCSAPASAGLVVLAVRQTWAQAIFVPPRPLPAQAISVTGQQLVPLASALALAALACLAAVIATRSAARRVAGVLLAALGAGAAAAAGAGCRLRPCSPWPSPVPPPARSAGRPPAARRRAARRMPSSSRGSAGHAVMTGMPWRAAAVAGAVAVIVAGLRHRVARPALAGHVGPVRSARASGRASGRASRPPTPRRSGNR